MFEGVPVHVACAYEKILVEEYGFEALVETTFKNHRFDEEKQEWVPLRLVRPQCFARPSTRHFPVELLHILSCACSCKDFGSCDYFRNKVDGVNLPADVPKVGDTQRSTT